MMVAGIPLLETRELTRRFGNRTVVDRVSLRLARGRSFGLAGESGSGKTTLAYLLARLLTPSEGEVLLNGEDWLRLKGRALRRARRRIQVVFQDPYSSLNPEMTVRRIVEEPLVVHRMQEDLKSGKVNELLESVRLGAEFADRFPGELSGGQRQRVAIARAIALDPDVLIADEPVSALDPENRQAVIQLLSDLRRELDLTLILIAHDLEMIRSSCEECAVMRRGRIVELAPTEELFSRAVHPYTHQLLAALEMRDQPAPTEPEIPDLVEIGPGHWAALNSPPTRSVNRERFD